MEQKLGRGLSALLGDGLENESRNGGVSPRNVNIDLIESNDNQPRKLFDEDSISELAESISRHGILQPIIVRQLGDKYKIIAGERRWRAAKLAGLIDIPVQIVECDDVGVVTLALIENIQREDLNPIEEAEALRVLMDSCGCRQEDLGTMISKSRSYVANALRLLALPENVQILIRTGRLSAGHGKCLLGVPNASKLADDAANNGWSVRYLENIVQCIKHESINGAVMDDKGRVDVASLGSALSVTQDIEAADISIRISESLGLEAKLKISRRGGVVILYCKSYQELEGLVETLVSIGGKKNLTQEV
ncbi:MAG: ParB/RepB/Spo0J family partition protein [Holosporales bacterium]|jgi:ParB family chromosome partitioning protein|nr:ParB/RepB/Spo0J family partition protein [Holosporales bacterium]